MIAEIGARGLSGPVVDRGTRLLRWDGIQSLGAPAVNTLLRHHFTSRSECKYKLLTGDPSESYT
jgi:hypothetical protein